MKGDLNTNGITFMTLKVIDVEEKWINSALRTDDNILW